jgi:hypothetical protein
VEACRVALRYLKALDLDRTREACRLFAPSTLEAAGGMAGCTRRLAQARGIRIRYSLVAASESPLGTVILFSTRGKSRGSVRQEMLVSSSRRIVAILPAR